MTLKSGVTSFFQRYVQDMIFPHPCPSHMSMRINMISEFPRPAYFFTMTSSTMHSGAIKTTVPSSPTKKYTAETPFNAALLQKTQISKYYSLTLGLGDSNIHYRPGDHVGIFPENKPSQVQEALSIFNLKETAESVVLSFLCSSGNKAIKGTPRNLFTSYFDLSAAACIYSIKIFSQLASDGEEKKALKEISLSKVCYALLFAGNISESN